MLILAKHDPQIWTVGCEGRCGKDVRALGVGFADLDTAKDGFGRCPCGVYLAKKSPPCPVAQLGIPRELSGPVKSVISGE